MTQPLATINLVVYNGERYIHHCLEAITKQTYPNLEINIWDNASTDQTRTIIERDYPQFNLIKGTRNLGMWPAQEAALEHSHGRYVVAISVDIILDPHFVEEAVKLLEHDSSIGALEAKIYQYRLADIDQGKELKREVIDTCGFQIFRSREVTNIGHGEQDHGQYDQQMEIFGVEGAVPVFRREALEDSRIQGHFIDPDFFWYGDDLDLAWRLNLLGWKQLYSPRVIAYHDRSTTKNLSKGRLSFIQLRKTIPLRKRLLDYRNTVLTIIKNDYLMNILRDLPAILWRHFQLWGYFVIFEPQMILELVTIVKLLPRMVQRRRLLMRKARVSAKQIHRWFYYG